MITMATAAAAKPTKAPPTPHTNASASSRTVFIVENVTSKPDCVLNRRSPLAEPTNTA